MPVTKRVRFEIFKRDAFTCQYCGNRPPDVILEVDHIDPKANGGEDHELNLITSCFACNRGKAHKRLSDIHPRPDADLAYLEVQQEIVEAKRFMEATAVRDSLAVEFEDRLENIWCRTFDTDMIPIDAQWKSWMTTFSADEIDYAIRQTSNFRNRKPWLETRQLIKYVSGVLWRRREQA